MNKILILSDSHLTYDFTNIIKKENPNYTIHAGDSEISENSYALNNIDYMVKGNCDISNFDEIKYFTLYDEKFLLTHGHMFNVKLGLNSLIYKTLENFCNVLIYGHTHIVHIEYLEDKNLLILNPGSTNFGRDKYKTTYIILEINDNMYTVYLKNSKTFKTINVFKYNKT